MNFVWLVVRPMKCIQHRTEYKITAHSATCPSVPLCGQDCDLNFKATFIQYR